MNRIEEAILRAKDRITTTEKRIEALEALRGNNLDRDPVGVELALFWVRDIAGVPSNRADFMIRAMRFGDQWVWMDFASHAVVGPWEVLIYLITSGHRYPVAVSLAGAGPARSLLPGVAHDPRTLTE